MEGQQKRPFREALVLYLRDRDQAQLGRIARTLGLILAGYAPIAALNDILAPVTFGIVLADNLLIPVGILVAVKIFIDVQKYRLPDYQPRR